MCVASTADTFDLLALDSHMAVGGREQLLMVATLQPPNPASIARFRRCLLERRAAVGERLLGVVLPAAPRPRLDADARRALLELWGDLGIHLLACAIWIRRGSFIGAFQRSLVTGVLMARQAPIATGVSATAAEAVDVLARVEPSVDPTTRRDWTSVLERFAAEHTSLS